MNNRTITTISSQSIQKFAEDLLNEAKERANLTTSPLNKNKWTKLIRLCLLEGLAFVLDEFVKKNSKEALSKLSLTAARRELKNLYCVLTQPLAEKIEIEELSPQERQACNYEFQINLKRGWGIEFDFELMELIETENPVEIAREISFEIKSLVAKL